MPRSQSDDGAPIGAAVPVDYDTDPGRFAANQLATRRFLPREDVHPGIARRMAAAGHRCVVDIGGGNGALARGLAAEGVRAVVVDQAAYVAEAPAPAVRANAFSLPFSSQSFDGAAAVWMLYHLTDPVAALVEARRVLRPGGLVAVSAPSHDDDPELAPVLPFWGRATSFDAENGVGILGQVFEVVDVERWDAPLIDLPDRDALTVYLRGRGLSEPAAKAAAGRLEPPLRITKRGMVAWGRKAA